ncbi:hypothetical protein [Cellulomonas xiejunii]|uniref:hypothetical protein n=1 Tax=Cellulomonas xiejunii TaxID=2968083 RepID=UPI0027E20C62|nr:hypothetical protein [Cellulomonas xiejunii]
MTTVHRLSRVDARRVAVRAQLLALPRPDGVMEVVRHLGVLQPDPTSAVAPRRGPGAVEPSGQRVRTGGAA